MGIQVPRISLSLIVGALLVTVAACEEAPAVRAPQDMRYGAIESQVSFTQPWFDTKKGPTEHIGISIDEQRVGRCDRGDGDDRTTCLETPSVTPGWHFVSIDYSYGHGVGQTYAHLEDHVLVGAQETITYDLSKAIDGDQTKYVVHKSKGTSGTACEKQLLALAGGPTCTAAELATIAKTIDAADAECKSITPGEESRAQGFLSYAFDNIFLITSDRCLTPKVIARTPKILTATAGNPKWWPPNTLKHGSWGWARDVLPAHFDDSGRIPRAALTARLAVARTAVAALMERLAVVEDFTTAYASNLPVKAAVDKALRAPFDLDPRTPAGHRMHLLLHGPDFARASAAVPSPYYDERFAEYVTRNIAATTSLHCGQGPEARLVLGYLYADGKLTAAEWAAVQGMIKRTPSDARLADACTEAAGNLGSDVPQVDRLRWVAAQDCAPARAAAVRGEATRARVSEDIPADVIKRVRAELGECLGKEDAN